MGDKVAIEAPSDGGEDKYLELEMARSDMAQGVLVAT